VNDYEKRPPPLPWYPQGITCPPDRVPLHQETSCRYLLIHSISLLVGHTSPLLAQLAFDISTAF